MNTAAQVDELIVKIKQEITSKSERVIKIAEACMGWPYIYGDRGVYCTAAHRKAVYNSHPTQTGLIDKCRILKSGASGCGGCNFYPGGKTRGFDCRGFTYWVVKQATGKEIMGAGATSQYNDDSNWSAKGKIEDMPNCVCCVFKYKDGKMQHTGLHVGDGKIIHCSNGVQTGKTTDRGWTHYAIPVALSGESPIPPAPEPVNPDSPDKPQKGTAIVAGNNVALRLGPSTSAGIIQRIPTGKVVNVATPPEDWQYVEYNGKRGYMMKKYLNISKE